MTSSSNNPPSTSGFSERQLTNKVEPKHCWVCFANEDDDYTAQWASPCKCRGTAKWVHKACLQRWIDEKQQGNSSIEVACPQCNSTYIIIYPKSGVFVRVLDMIDRIICKACPFLAGGILVGSVYWTAVTYGAVTIMQILGHKEGLNVMEKADPLIMLIGLPTIPVMLMLGRLIRWEDAVLKFWRKHSTKLPLLNMIFPNTNNQYLPRLPTVSYSSNSDPVSFTRTICGGLILPTIATIFGKLLFQRINSNFQRSIIGGITFIGLKGIFKIYYKQQQFLRQAHRQIKNYETTNNNNIMISSSSNNSNNINNIDNNNDNNSSNLSSYFNNSNNNNNTINNNTAFTTRRSRNNQNLNSINETENVSNNYSQIYAQTSLTSTTNNEPTPSTGPKNSTGTSTTTNTFFVNKNEKTNNKNKKNASSSFTLNEDLQPSESSLSSSSSASSESFAESKQVNLVPNNNHGISFVDQHQTNEDEED